MILWLHHNHLTHPLLAGLIMLLAWLPLRLFAVRNAAWIAAALAVAFYWGREKAQHEARLIGRGARHVLDTWYLGWTPFEWGRDGQLDFWPVLLAAVVLALALQRIRW
jgi:hypothetical protein